jgi:hypothetical protein
MVKQFNHKQLSKHNATAQLALQTPIVNYRDGFGCVGPRGKHIDKDSYLKYNSLMTQHGSKNNLPHSGFLTVPFMGSGCRRMNSEPRLEFESTCAPKSALNSGVRNRFVPLVGCLATEVQNTEHIIPEDSHDGWLRGGFPSRRCKTIRGPFPKPICSNVWPINNNGA